MLAEYVMRGRTQAILAAIITTALPLFFWLGAAVIGLVTLRKGWREGMAVLVWAILPAAVMAWFGEIIPATTMIGTLILAQLLRETISWSKALCGTAIFGSLLGIALVTFGAEYLAVLEEFFATVFSEMASQFAEQGQQVELVPPVATEIAGAFAAMQAVTLVVCLMIARWWQALLFNPGGFQQEFQQLQLSWQQTSLLILAAVILLYGLTGYTPWAWIVAVPLLFAGLGLIHGLAARQGISGHWLGVFYFLLIMIEPVKLMVLLLACLDSWLNLRNRIGVNS
jgi:hypothetical protein